RLLSIPLRDLALPGVKTCFGEMKCGTEVSSRLPTAPPQPQQPSPMFFLRRIAPFWSWHGNALLSESMLPTAGRCVHGTVTIDKVAMTHAVIPVRIGRKFVTCLDPLRGKRLISVRKFEQARRLVANWAIVTT